MPLHTGPILVFVTCCSPTYTTQAPATYAVLLCAPRHSVRQGCADAPRNPKCRHARARLGGTPSRRSFQAASLPNKKKPRCGLLRGGSMHPGRGGALSWGVGLAARRAARLQEWCAHAPHPFRTLAWRAAAFLWATFHRKRRLTCGTPLLPDTALTHTSGMSN